MASVQHGSRRITLQHIWNSTGSKPEYFALHLDLFKYKQISTFLHYVLKCVLEGTGGGPITHTLVFPSSWALAQTQMMSSGCLYVFYVSKSCLYVLHT